MLIATVSAFLVDAVLHAPFVALLLYVVAIPLWGGGASSTSALRTWGTAAVAVLLALLAGVVTWSSGNPLVAHVSERATIVVAVLAAAWWCEHVRRREQRAVERVLAENAEHHLAPILEAERRGRDELYRRSRVLLSVLEDLQEERSRLANEVRQRERLAADLRASNAELQQFAYVASHDLQTPLRGISGFAQILAEDYSENLDAKAHEYIDRIVGGVRRMSDLIRDLLEFSRLDASPKEFGPVDLEAIVDDVVASMEPVLLEANAEVARDPLPTVKGDDARLTQLLQNLIDNAVKYRGAEPLRVRISAARDGDDWTVVVADNGIGIEPRQQEKIFELFRRLHGQDEIPGTGIGLAVCRKVVQRHGGRIWVESEQGRGSRFLFTLPAAEAARSE